MLKYPSFQFPLGKISYLTIYHFGLLELKLTYVSIPLREDILSNTSISRIGCCHGGTVSIPLREDILSNIFIEALDNLEEGSFNSP